MARNSRPTGRRSTAPQQPLSQKWIEWTLRERRREAALTAACPNISATRASEVGPPRLVAAAALKLLRGALEGFGHALDTVEQAVVALHGQLARHLVGAARARRHGAAIVTHVGADGEFMRHGALLTFAGCETKTPGAGPGVWLLYDVHNAQAGCRLPAACLPRSVIAS